MSQPEVDTFLQDNPDIALLVRQVEDLLELHAKLVAEGRLPAYSLMGLHKDYSASHQQALLHPGTWGLT